MSAAKDKTYLVCSRSGEWYYKPVKALNQAEAIRVAEAREGSELAVGYEYEVYEILGAGVKLNAVIGLEVQA